MVRAFLFGEGISLIELLYEDMELIWALNGYKPSPEQRAVHEALLRPNNGIDPETGEVGPLPSMAVLAGGEQSGKSFLGGMHCWGRWLVDPLIWLVGNRYEDAKREYEYVRDAAVAADLHKRASFAEDGPWELVYKTGQVVKVLASEDVTKLAREAPDGIIMCEPGRQSYESFRACWRRAVPRTAWMLVAGTFERDKGSVEPWYPDLWNACQGENSYHASGLSLPSHANRSLYPRGEADPKFRAAIRTVRDTNKIDPDDEIGERFYGIPRKHQGAVFSRNFSRQLHVRHEAEYLPGIDVSLAIDPGFANAFAVLFIQVVSDQARVFDELYLHGIMGPDIISMVEQHRSFPDLNHIVIDVAAKSHHNAQGSAMEEWRNHFGSMGISVVGRYVGVEDGLAATRRRLRVDPMTNQPLTIFHPRCVNTIWELEKGYRYHERRGDGIIASEKPEDKNNHASKALAYWFMDRYGYADVKQLLPGPVSTMSPYDRAFNARRQGYAGARR